jgi:hypothetical protein
LYENEDDYCSWSFTEETNTLTIDWNMEEPIYLLDNEEMEWTTTAKLTREEMEQARCPDHLALA